MIWLHKICMSESKYDFHKEFFLLKFIKYKFYINLNVKNGFKHTLSFPKPCENILLLTGVHEKLSGCWYN